MTFTVENLHDLIQLLEDQPTWLTEVRRVVLTKELLTLPEQLTEVQRSTAHELQQLTTQVAALAEAQRHTDAQVAALVNAQSRTETEVRQVASWQRGEGGRRDGERYERDIARQAAALFNGGLGGPTTELMVQQRLAGQLSSVFETEFVDASVNPLLADVIWWKGDTVAVVEVSLQVDRYDVERAAQRAATLRRSGAHVIAVVIGEQWATDETREEARRQQVEWKIGADLSEGLLAFRKLSHAQAEQP